MSRRGYSGRSGRGGSSRNAGYSRYSSGGRAHFRKRRFNASSPLERVLILLVIAVVIGISVGIGLPKVSPDVGKLTGE